MSANPQLATRKDSTVQSFQPAQPQWYTVHCKPLKEWQAAAALQDCLGLVVYLPEVRRSFRNTLQRAALFPRYLFIRVNLQSVAMSQINAQQGVHRMVTFDDEMPVAVPDDTIKALYHRVEELNNQGGLPAHNFQPGDAVRMKRGPLEGLEAVFVGPTEPSERVRILIEFLGHLRQAEVNADMLEPSASPPPESPKRRTRGKGRRITNDNA